MFSATYPLRPVLGLRSRRHVSAVCLAF